MSAWQYTVNMTSELINAQFAENVFFYNVDI